MKNTNKLMLLGGVVGLLLAAAPVLADMGNGPKADTNKDGTIDRAEFDAERAARFKAIDGNGDGFISTDEMAAYREQRRGERAAHFLTRIDTSGDGKISAAEWQANSLQKFVKLDSNGDGAVTADEFQNMHKRPAGKDGDAAGRHGDFKDRLARLDTDKDGKVSTAEWNAVGNKMFARMDDNKDGKISADEMPRHRKGDQLPESAPSTQPN
jgi:Ca2+-binding EF-hand superfamily protein